MNDDLTTLDGTYSAAWRELEDGASQPDSPAKVIALATQAILGGGAVRMVVLRNADRLAALLDLLGVEESLDPVLEGLLRLRDRLAINAWGRVFRDPTKILPDSFPRDVVCQ